MNHLERALPDQNDWWRYLLNFLITFVGASFLGSIPLLFFILKPMVSNEFEPEVLENVSKGVLDFDSMGISNNLGLFLMLLPFVLGFILFIFTMKWFHNRNWIEVINGLKKIRWPKFFTGYFIWFALSAAFLLISLYTSPNDFVFQFEWSSFWPLMLISLLIIPIQSSYEELFFRGYLAQGFAAWSGSRFVAVLAPSILFGLLHAANPEVQEYGFWLTMPQYIGFGIIFGLAATFDDGIESAMGAHAANNTFLSMFLTSEASALQTNAVFKQTTVHPETDVYSLLFFGVIFLLILSRIYKWDWSVLNKKVLPVKSDTLFSPEANGNENS